MGSIMAVHKEQVAIPAKQTEAVDTWAAQKNKIQCAPIRPPVIKNLSKAFHFTLISFFLYFSKKYKPALANIVR
jgi:hypothetical protein